MHWETDECPEFAAKISDWGYSVACERDSGPDDCRKVIELQPDVVVISLRKSVSLGRETGRFISMNRKTKHIPLIYMDGPRDNRRDRITALVPTAKFSAIQELEELLGELTG